MTPVTLILLCGVAILIAISAGLGSGERLRRRDAALQRAERWSRMKTIAEGSAEAAPLPPGGPRWAAFNAQTMDEVHRRMAAEGIAAMKVLPDGAVVAIDTADLSPPKGK